MATEYSHEIGYAIIAVVVIVVVEKKKISSKILIAKPQRTQRTQSKNIELPGHPLL